MACVESTRLTDWNFASVRWRSLWLGAAMTSIFFRSRAKRSINSERSARRVGPLMAAALHHARRDDLRRAVLLAGYAFSEPKKNPAPVCLPVHLRVQQRVRDRAVVEHPAATVETWLRAGERLTEEQAAAIAFDDAPLDDRSD